jgi:hypothetical protein
MVAAATDGYLWLSQYPTIPPPTHNFHDTNEYDTFTRSEAHYDKFDHQPATTRKMQIEHLEAHLSPKSK